jgi:2-polyprenyl-3-methyl-5-hydroxy-6-metoxy-1,4-benzoquinol methylase
MNEVDRLNEEIFCLNYELKTFAGYVNYNRLERWVKNYSDRITEESHLQRYQFAKQFVKDKVVLDMACGSGYGTFILANEGFAKQTVGIDLDFEAIRYASFRNQHQNVTFQQGNAMNFCMESHFDVIVSFETIEHLPQIDNYLINVNKSLKKDGVFLVSTPVSGKEINNDPINKYHVQEWGFKKFQQMLSDYVVIDKIFLQVYPLIKNSLISRVSRRIFNNNSNYSSQLIEYTEKSVDASTLGKNRQAFQILVCKKKL